MPNMVCSVSGCTNKYKARGLCKRHYELWRLAHPDQVKQYTPKPDECIVDGCSKPVNGRGLCAMHYSRWLRSGTTDSAKPNPHGTVEERFWRHVDKSGPLGCWVWTGSTRGTNGYGSLKLRTGSLLLAHRFSYELHVAPIPPGLEIDHICRNRACVNPAHLEPVTRGENVRRGVSPSAINARKTHCKNGHEFTEANTYYMKWRQERVCRICSSESQRAYQKRKRLKR